MHKILAARDPYDNTVILASHLPQPKANHATLAHALPFTWDCMIWLEHNHHLDVDGNHNVERDG